MNAMTTHDRMMIDITRVRPEDVALLTDEAFRAVVDADLRRRAPKGWTLSTEVAEALRSETNVERWYTHLCRIAASVGGQLDARAADFEAQRSTLRAQGADQREIDELHAAYMTSKARTVRFRTGLDEAIVEAQALLGVDGSDYYSRMVALEQAIEAHRDALLGEAIEANEYDETLWSILDRKVA